MANIITIYFSIKGQTIGPGMKLTHLDKGNTAVAAEFIQKAVGGDLFEIEADRAYSNPWHTMPMVLFTFLEHYDWTGKRIIPFCTNEGSGLGNSVSDIKKLCPDAEVDEGASFTGSQVRESEGKIAGWAKSRL